MKILVTGANGQLGRELLRKFPDAIATDAQDLDITDAQALASFDWSKVDTIVNAAAYTNVDGAETAEGSIASQLVNAQAVGNLAAIASLHGLTLVHISTDYVFDGTSALHSEDEPFSPLSVYGTSKADGDLLAATTPKHYILRTSWVIGDGKNFVRTMLGLAERGISPTVVSDQVGRLTFTSELVRAIEHLLTTKQPFGTYNVSNGGETTSWADITRQIFKIAGADELKVTNTTTSEYFIDKPEAARRPLQSTLDLTKIQSTGFTPRDWKENLVEYIQMENNR